MTSLPKISWINLTDFCNNHCVWCYAKDSSSQNRYMSYDRAITIIKWAKRMGCKECILIGGEPTLHPRFFDIVSAIVESGMFVSIVSNGRFFSNNEFARQLQSVGVKTGNILFSMSSPSEDEAEHLTGVKSSFIQFAQAFENLANLGIVPGINIVISGVMKNYINKMIHWAISKNVEALTFNLVAPTVSRTGVDASVCLPPNELAKLVYSLFQETNRLPIKVQFLFNIPYCLLESRQIAEMLQAGVLSSGCHVKSGSGVLFDTTGNLISCNHLLDFPLMSYDQVEQLFDQDRFTEVWDNDILTKSRQYARAYRAESCKTCNMWNYCGGGCPVFWSYYDPKEYIKGI